MDNIRRAELTASWHLFPLLCLDGGPWMQRKIPDCHHAHAIICLEVRHMMVRKALAFEHGSMESLMSTGADSDFPSECKAI